MIFGIFFAFWRFMQIITLIPTLGMLAYFVDGYRKANALTPDYILILFIVSVLGAAWAVATLFTYHRSRNNSLFVAFIDLLFVGAFIGAVYSLRAAARWNCTNWSHGGSLVNGSSALGSFNINGANVRTNKTCAMLKSSWVFGLMNILFFFFTAILALLVGKGEKKSSKTYVTKETHYARHGHRRSGSHRSSHSRSHSGRRTAYV